jgi:hypothetical protein
VLNPIGGVFATFHAKVLVDVRMVAARANCMADNDNIVLAVLKPDHSLK